MRRKHYIILAIVILVVCAILWLPWVEVDRKSVSAHAKSNLHTIQIALERYCDDHGGPIDGKRELGCVYPEDISMLIEQDYFISFPINPYTNKQMKFIELGSEPQSGEFTYVPLYENGKVRFYYLFAYGDENYPYYSEELDNYGFRRVLINLKSGLDIYDDIQSVEGYFLKGASVPTLLDKWKKPGQDKSDE